MATKGKGRPKSGYKNRAGESIPGVTTILGRFKESGGLLQWAFQQGKLAEQGLIRNLYDKRDESADAGTLAHTLIERHIHGQDTSLLIAEAPVEIRDKAQNCFAQFLKWYDQVKPKILETELALVSEPHQFGGTIDAVGEIDGEVCLIDWKTSNSIYVDHLCQLAAYKVLIEECTNYRVTGGFHLLRMSKESADFSHHHFGELEDGWEMFWHFRCAWDLDKRLKDRV
jgi:PD-(D/E)XK nuclease superfamily